MHAAGIEFDHALFVGKAAQSDAIVVRIVLRSLDHAESGVQRVAAVFQESERVVEIFHAIVSTDNDRPLARVRAFILSTVVLCA